MRAARAVRAMRSGDVDGRQQLHRRVRCVRCVRCGGSSSSSRNDGGRRAQPDFIDHSDGAVQSSVELHHCRPNVATRFCTDRPTTSPAPHK